MSAEVLTHLQSHTAEIVSLAQRRPQTAEVHNNGRLTMHYLAPVDGDDYVVTVTDMPMSRRRVKQVVGEIEDAVKLGAYDGCDKSPLSETLRDVRRKAILHRLYEGEVIVWPREVFETNRDIDDSCGSIGYTFRNGARAVLRSSGLVSVDPDLFVEAIGAVNRDDLINPKTNLTAFEESRHAELHTYLIRNINQLISRDGYPVRDVASFYVNMNPPGVKIPSTVWTEALKSTEANADTRMVVYGHGTPEQLLIIKRGKIGNYQIEITLEVETAPGIFEHINYIPRKDNPNIFMKLPPEGSPNTAVEWDKRKNTLTDGETLALNSRLASELCLPTRS